MISMTLFFNMAMAAGNVFLSPEVASPPKVSFEKLPQTASHRRQI